MPEKSALRLNLEHLCHDQGVYTPGLHLRLSKNLRERWHIVLVYGERFAPILRATVEWQLQQIVPRLRNADWELIAAASFNIKTQDYVPHETADLTQRRQWLSSNHPALASDSTYRRWMREEIFPRLVSYLDDPEKLPSKSEVDSFVYRTWLARQLGRHA